MGLENPQNTATFSRRVIKRYVYSIGVSMVLVIFFSIIFLVSLVNLAQLTELSQKHLTVWEKIIREINVANRKPLSRPLTEEMAVRSQSRVKQYLEDEEEISKNIKQKSGWLKFYRIIGWLSEPELDVINSANVPSQFRHNIFLFQNAPLNILHNGFSYWDTASLVSLYSGAAIDSLHKRFYFLANLQRKHFNFMPWVLVLLPSIVLLKVFYIWYRGISPLLRQIDNTLAENIIQRINAVKAKDELMRGEHELRVILNNLPAMVAKLDAEFNFELINNAYFHAFGYNNETEFQGKHVRDLLGESFYIQIESKLQEARNGTYVKFETTIPFSMGDKRVQVNYVPLRDVSSGRVNKILALIVDIDERYQIERSLRNSEENIRITLNSIGEAVIATDENGIVQRINPVAALLTGWTGDSAIGHPVEEVFRVSSSEAAEPTQNLVYSVLQTGKSAPAAEGAVLTSKNGDEYPIADSGAPILDFKGQIRGVVLVFRDVSEEYRLRSDLIQLEKMRALGVLTGGISHNFNNILAGIAGASELLKVRCQDKLNGTDINLLDKILLSVQHGSDLSNKLTKFVRNTEYEFKVVDITNSVLEVLDILTSTTSRNIEVNYSNLSTNANVIGDESSLHSAILNIVINASHAMPNGGRLDAKIDNLDLTGKNMVDPGYDLQPGKYVVISIIDNGVGIESDKLDQIFDPFYTTRSHGEGAGLGLSIAYGTLQDHSGTILVESKVSVGTKFSILMPVTNQIDTSITEIQAHHEDLLTTTTILVVDDEVTLCQTFAEYLECLGHKVFTAHDGEKAIEVFKENVDKIQLVVIDLNMPRLNGAHTVKAMKKISSRCHYIGITGHSMNDFSLDGSPVGINVIMKKPFQLSALQKSIDHVLVNKHKFIDNRSSSEH